jgi:hypothetical protein
MLQTSRWYAFLSWWQHHCLHQRLVLQVYGSPLVVGPLTHVEYYEVRVVLPVVTACGRHAAY